MGGTRALYEENSEAARRKLYNEDAEGARRAVCYITRRTAGGRHNLTPGRGWAAGDLPDKELGQLEVREWAEAPKREPRTSSFIDELFIQ